MSDNTADITGAIVAISSVIESMERRQGELAIAIGAAKQQRNDLLNQRVRGLLPDISATSMKCLKQHVPAFAATPKISFAFEQNRKKFWVFKPSGYDEALLMLQTQLKLYLEREGVAEEDQLVQLLASEKIALAKQQAEALEMLRLMENARQAGAGLPPEAVTSINGLAKRGRDLRNNKSGGSASSINRFAGTQSVSSQERNQTDTDLWLWMISDIPTSFRTLMLSMFSHSHHHNEAHFDSSTASVVDAGNCNEQHGQSSDIAAPLTSLELACDSRTSIATDDQLGVFS